jgi:hypothetical protein
MTPKTQHRWRFFRAGGLDQVRFETAEDYRRLETLDQKLWVALACPVKGIEFDEKTLALIDIDHDGRVRATEVIAAVQWAEDRLKDLASLKAGSDSLPLDQINDSTTDGQAILASARQILKDIGKPEATAIALADVSDTSRIFAQTRLNGDGIIPADASDDPAVQETIHEIATTQGAEIDRSGKPGVSQATVDAFYSQLAGYDAWARQAETTPALRPIGDATEPAFEAFIAVRAKVDDYFARCRLAAFDSRAVAALNRPEDDYLKVASHLFDPNVAEVTDFPLARIEPGRPLPLHEGLNPAWSAAIGRLAETAIPPLLGPGKTSLTEKEWDELKSKFAAYDSWRAAMPASTVEGLGLKRIRALLHSSAIRDEIGKLLAADRALEPEATAIADVEQLVRYYRDLHRLLTNFVNFAEFYQPERGATFQVGTLYLDARACDLCVRVDDAAKHAVLAGMAKVYLAYCDCSRASGEKLTIAAAFTNGDSDNLMIGRNGVFYDRKGRDWDATISKIIENPISIRQAFWAPYKKLVRLIEEQVAKRAAAADTDAERRLTSAATTAANVDKTGPAPAKKIDTGTVAALGVAFGFIASAFAAVIGHAIGLFRMPFWQLCLAFAALLLIISGPSMLIAWLKLRQRNIGPILDASGWAVNGRVKIPMALGRSLTSVAKLPPGTVPVMDTRFAEPPAVWPKLLGLAIALGFIYSLLNHYGLIHRWTAGRFGINPLVERPASLLDQLRPSDATNAPAADTAGAPATPPAQTPPP